MSICWKLWSSIVFKTYGSNFVLAMQKFHHSIVQFYGGIHLSYDITYICVQYEGDFNSHKKYCITHIYSFQCFNSDQLKTICSLFSDIPHAINKPIALHKLLKYLLPLFLVYLKKVCSYLIVSFMPIWCKLTWVSACILNLH